MNVAVLTVSQSMMEAGNMSKLDTVSTYPKWKELLDLLNCPSCSD